jgi:thiamine-phosphate pyrophosphorylase
MPVDYIAIGPIFPTTTKSGPNPAIGLEGLRQVRAAIGDRPLVAIGGIKLSQRQEILDSGADALAVISDFWVSQSDLPQ